MARQGRRGHRKPRSAGGFKQPPWRRVSNPYKPIEVLREEQVEKIHEASLEVLENLGLEFLSDEALSILDAAGADVDHARQHRVEANPRRRQGRGAQGFHRPPKARRRRNSGVR